MGKCYSIDGEDFNMTGFGEVIFELQQDYEDGDIVGLNYWEAAAVPLTPEDCFSVDSILCQIDDSAYEEIGEVYDGDFENVSDEARQELRDLIKNWCDKHITLRYWKVINPEEKTVTEDDLK